MRCSTKSQHWPYENSNLRKKCPFGCLGKKCRAVIRFACVDRFVVSPSQTSPIMLLTNKTALVFGATGAIGSATARYLRQQGAQVVLSARNPDTLLALSKELDCPFETVDATDEAAVEFHVAKAVRTHGQIDVCFNAVGPRPAEVGYGKNISSLSVNEFLQTIEIIAGSQFLVSRAVSRYMARSGAGSIITLSASLTGQFVPYMSGVSAACGAIEGMTRSLAAELGPQNVRVNCVRSGGMPETRTIQETLAEIAKTTGIAAAPNSASTTLMKRPVMPAEVAAFVGYLASDRASAITGQVINVCAGAVVSH